MFSSAWRPLNATKADTPREPITLDFYLYTEFKNIIQAISYFICNATNPFEEYCLSKTYTSFPFSFFSPGGTWGRRNCFVAGSTVVFHNRHSSLDSIHQLVLYWRNCSIWIVSAQTILLHIFPFLSLEVLWVILTSPFQEIIFFTESWRYFNQFLCSCLPPSTYQRLY